MSLSLPQAPCCREDCAHPTERVETHIFTDVSGRPVPRRACRSQSTHALATQDDPFHTELATFIGVLDGRRANEDILSTYEDAIKTYELVRAEWHRVGGESADSVH